MITKTTTKTTALKISAKWKNLPQFKGKKFIGVT